MDSFAQNLIEFFTHPMILGLLLLAIIIIGLKSVFKH